MERHRDSPTPMMMMMNAIILCNGSSAEAHQRHVQWVRHRSTPTPFVIDDVDDDVDILKCVRHREQFLNSALPKSTQCRPSWALLISIVNLPRSPSKAAHRASPHSTSTLHQSTHIQIGTPSAPMIGCQKRQERPHAQHQRYLPNSQANSTVLLSHLSTGSLFTKPADHTKFRITRSHTLRLIAFPNMRPIDFLLTTFFQSMDAGLIPWKRKSSSNETRRPRVLIQMHRSPPRFLVNVVSSPNLQYANLNELPMSTKRRLLRGSMPLVVYHLLKTCFTMRL